MKNEQYYNVGTILIDWCLTPTSAVFQLYRGVEIGNIDTLNTQIHDRSISCLGTVTTIKRGGVKLVLWTQTLFLNVYYFFHNT
jgi:hypothetical protein